jgi:hypothetical protein
MYNNLTVRGEIMTVIYKGIIRRYTVNQIEITENGVKCVKTETPIIRKDALFYRGICGKKISFDYDTPLPTYEEAESYAQQQVNHNQEYLGLANCLFVNDNEVRYYKEVSHKEFKEMKKKIKRK